MGDEISNPLIYLIYQKLNLTITQAAYPFCERKIPIPHQTDSHPEDVSLWLEDFRELVEIAISKIGDTKHKLQSKAGRDRLTSLYERKKNRYFYRSLNEQVYYYLDGLFAIHESDDNAYTAKHEARHNGAIIDAFLNKETFSWNALRRMAQSGGLYCGSLYSNWNLDKALLGEREHGDFNLDSINETTTLIESLYVLCDIPFNADNSNEHPKCVMEKVDVLKEAIKATLFFNWDGYLSWKKGIHILFVKDIVKGYVVNNAGPNQLISMMGNEYICNFAVSTKNDILDQLIKLDQELLKSTPPYEELLTIVKMIIYAQICILKTRRNHNFKIPPLPFKYNPDFSKIIKDGKQYFLTTMQAAVMKYMAEQHYDGLYDVPKIEMMNSIKNANVTTDPMKDVFKFAPKTRDALLKVGNVDGTIRLKF